MRKLGHWTPRYLFERAARHLFEKSHPGAPNLSTGAIRFLDHWLRKTDVVLEYGAGRSTSWFARRVGRIVSMESKSLWYEKVRKATAGFSNVELHLWEANQEMVPGCGVSWDYVKNAEGFPPESFDCVLNDGFARAYVGPRVLPLIKKGGILVWDDWLCPFSSSGYTPRAAVVDERLRERKPSEFLEMVRDWRSICLDDGVHSTAIFFKSS
jgi:predicted O-methyltransferase YrrM